MLINTTDHHIIVFPSAECIHIVITTTTLPHFVELIALLLCSLTYLSYLKSSVPWGPSEIDNSRLDPNFITIIHHPTKHFNIKKICKSVLNMGSIGSKLSNLSEVELVTIINSFMEKVTNVSIFILNYLYILSICSRMDYQRKRILYSEL